MLDKIKKKLLDLKIKYKLGIFIVALIILVAILFKGGYDFLSDKLIEIETSTVLAQTEEKFINLQRVDMEVLSSILEVASRDNEMKKLYREGSREELYLHTYPLFDNLKNRYNITHFLFHRMDGSVFLRIHEENLFNDKTNRKILEKAQAVKSVVRGMELGANGFAFRVVMPYYDGEELIGYLELGREIDRFLNTLRGQSVDEFVVVGKKNKLDQSQWERARENVDFNSSWDDFHDFVILNNPRWKYVKTNCFQEDKINQSMETGSSYVLGRIVIDEHTYICSSFPIIDVDKVQTGSIIMFHDVTDILGTVRNTMLVIFMVLVVVFFLIVFVSNIVINKILIKPILKLKNVALEISQGDLEKSVQYDSQDEIGQLAQSFNQMTIKLRGFYGVLENRVKQRTKELNQKILTIENQKNELGESKTAILNLMEDINVEKLHISEERAKYESLLSSIGDGVVATDDQRRIIFMNQSAKSLLAVAGEFMGKEWAVDFPKIVDANGKAIPKEKIASIRSLKIGEKSSAVYYYTRNDGGMFPAAVNVSPVVFNGKITGLIIVFRDITREITIDKAKTEFVSLASHQLRTPLSAINWYAEMLLAGDAGKLRAEQKSYVEEIYNGNQRMVELVSSLLNVSRIELGTLAVEPVLSYLPDFSKSVLEELKHQITDKKQKIIERYDSKLLKVKVDPKLMRIVFQNIISNAVKYTPEKGKIEIKISNDKEKIYIRVKDTGYGIPDNQKDKIFSKLFRADNIRQKDSDGTGLGLYIVKSIIEDSANGKIWFESEENKGTTFFIEIPLDGMEKREGSKTLS